jgi:hypothetical protein
MLASLCCSVWTTNGKSVSPRSRSKSNSAMRSSVGRSQNSKVRATSPTRMYSSIRPSSARISSVGGCVVEARGGVVYVLPRFEQRDRMAQARGGERGDAAHRPGADDEDVPSLHGSRRLY